MSNTLISGASTPTDPQWLGTYNGIVVNANDPLGQNRVQLQVPQVLGNAISNWAVSQQTGTAAPAVGTQVFVQFLGGNPNSPYYSEGLSSNVVENITSNTGDVLNANPYFVGGSLSTWSGNGGTISATQPDPSTDPPYQYGCLITATDTTGMVIQQVDDPFAAVAGNNYQVSAWAYYPVGGNVTLGVIYNDTPAQQGTTVDVPAATWTYLETVTTATPAATAGYPFIGPAQSNIGDLFTAESVVIIGQIDGALLEDSSVTADAVSFSATDIGGLSVTLNASGTAPTSPNDGDLWFDGTNGYQLNQYSAATETWSPYTYGTNAIAAGSITADLIAAGAVVAGTVAAGAIDGMTINAATINGQTLTAADIIITQNDGGFFYYTQGGGNTVVTTLSESGTWTCPTGVTSIQIEGWGGGGGGANGMSSAGGGGAEYACEPAMAVTPGNNYPFTIGTGGTAGAYGTSEEAGTAGSNTTFAGDSVTLTAHGGGKGNADGTGGSPGTGSTNTVANPGGMGGTGDISTNNVYTYSFTGTTHTFSGSGETLDLGQALQGGNTADTYNGSCFTFWLFDYEQIASDLSGENVTINSVQLTCINAHTYYDSGMTCHIGWSARTSFPETVPFPWPSNATDLFQGHIAEGGGATYTIDSDGSSFGAAFAGGGATSILFAVADGGESLTDYGYFDHGSDGDMKLIFNTTTDGTEGGGGGGSGGNGGAGGDGQDGQGNTGGSGGAAGVAGAAGTSSGARGGVGGTSAANTAGAGNIPGGGGGGGGYDVSTSNGRVGGNGGNGQIVITYIVSGTAVLGGSITGETSTDPLAGTSVPEGAYFDRLTMAESEAPATPTLGPLVYGTSAGFPDVIASGDGNTYSMARQSLIAAGQTISSTTATTITGLGITSLAASTTYRISGRIFYTPTNAAGTGTFSFGTTNGFTTVLIECLEFAIPSGTTGTAISLGAGEIIISRTGTFVTTTFGTASRTLHLSGTLICSAVNSFTLKAACTSSGTDSFSILAGSFIDLLPVT